MQSNGIWGDGYYWKFHGSVFQVPADSDRAMELRSQQRLRADMMLIGKSLRSLHHLQRLHELCSRIPLFSGTLTPSIRRWSGSKCPMESGKEREWNGWAAVVKTASSTCSIPLPLICGNAPLAWTWTKKDNLFAHRQPDAVQLPRWWLALRMRSWLQWTERLLSNAGGLFTVKEDAEDIFSWHPFWLAQLRVRLPIWCFDQSVVGHQFLGRSAKLIFREQHLKYQFTPTKTTSVTSNEKSSWIYRGGVIERHHAVFRGEVPRSARTMGHSRGYRRMLALCGESSWYGVYGGTLDGKPVWHNSTGDSKLFNDMETMAYDVTTKYLEQVLNDQNKYIWAQSQMCTSRDCNFQHRCRQSLRESYMLRINNSSTPAER